MRRVRRRLDSCSSAVSCSKAGAMPAAAEGVARERPHRRQVGAALPRGRASPRSRTARRGRAPPPHQTPPWAVDADSVVARAARAAGVGDRPGVAHPAVDGQCLAAPAGPESPARRAARPVQRYEWPRPGDMLHVDIKPLGRIGVRRPSHPWRSPPGQPRDRLGVRARGGR